MRKHPAALKRKPVAEDLDTRLLTRFLVKPQAVFHGNEEMSAWCSEGDFSFSVCGLRWLIGYQDVINQGWKQGQNREFDGAASFHSLFALIEFSFYVYCESFVQFY